MRRPQNLKKNLPPFLRKQLFSLSSVKTSGRFFQISVAFSEKLDLRDQIRVFFVRYYAWYGESSFIVGSFLRQKCLQEHSPTGNFKKTSVDRTK